MISKSQKNVSVSLFILTAPSGWSSGRASMTSLPCHFCHGVTFLASLGTPLNFTVILTKWFMIDVKYVRSRLLRTLQTATRQHEEMGRPEPELKLLESPTFRVCTRRHPSPAECSTAIRARRVHLLTHVAKPTCHRKLGTAKRTQIRVERKRFDAVSVRLRQQQHYETSDVGCYFTRLSSTSRALRRRCVQLLR